ncbi:MAG: tRNA (guanosine(46)-N7)-methyltransferase TrmB, partial [Pseudomonadota bacterium]
WPKARHTKRRLINEQLLTQLSSKMKSGAELRVATDIGDYLRTALLAFRQSNTFDWTATRPPDWRIRPDDWPSTRYEAKAIREGRCCYYLRFNRY